MPWNNQNGGGGWKSGGSGGGGGPWGQGPQGGGPGQQPDLEELLKKSQDKLKQAMPGGGGTGLIWLLAALLLLGVWISQSVHTIKPDEKGVVLQFGKYHRTLGSGFRLVYWPIETIEKVKFAAENQLNFGTNSSFNNSSDNSESLMLAGDRNLVDIQFTVLWKIKDSQQYLFNVKDPERLVRVVAESAMREIVGRTPAEKVRTDGRFEAQEQVQKLIQSALDTYQAGILIRGVKLEKADPPPKVIDAFEDVQRAEQNQNKFIREAEQYRNKLLGEAKGKVSKITEEAKAYKARVVAEAEGEAQRFISVYEEYAKAKDVTRKRLFLETMENVLSKSNKVIIEKGGPGVVPYLPLPEVQKRTNRGN